MFKYIPICDLPFVCPHGFVLPNQFLIHPCLVTPSLGSCRNSVLLIIIATVVWNPLSFSVGRKRQNCSSFISALFLIILVLGVSELFLVVAGFRLCLNSLCSCKELKDFFVFNILLYYTIFNIHFYIILYLIIILYKYNFYLKYKLYTLYNIQYNILPIIYNM